MNSESNHAPINAIVFLICMAMIAALILPAIARQRTGARQSGCRENLRTIGLGFHNYHSAYRQLPTTCGGTVGSTDESCNRGRLGAIVGLLPFVENQELWEAISNPYNSETTGQRFPAMGPVPWYDANIYQPWSRGPSEFRCPEGADEPAKTPEPKIVYTLKVSHPVEAGLTTNYVVSFGDGTHEVGVPANMGEPEPNEVRMRARAAQRGMFMPGKQMKFRDVLDGLSNTIMLSETRASVKREPDTGIAKNVEGVSDNPSLCLTAAKDANTQWWDFGRGSRWCDGALPVSGFTTVLPPNSPSCTSEQGMFEGVISASSDHANGVHVLFGDGSIAFISNTIDAGDSTAPGVRLNGTGTSTPGSQSPYGLWGALGTRASKESTDEQIDRLASDRRDRRDGRSAVSIKDDFMIWTDREGKVKLSARFVRIIEKKTIELEDANGTLHQVPLNTLQDKDIFRAVSMDRMAHQSGDQGPSQVKSNEDTDNSTQADVPKRKVEIEPPESKLSKIDPGQTAARVNELAAHLVNTRWQDLKTGWIMGFDPDSKAFGWKQEPGVWSIGPGGTILLKFSGGRSWTMHVNAGFTEATAVNDVDQGNRMQRVQ